jgi:hypothetical protein
LLLFKHWTQVFCAEQTRPVGQSELVTQSTQVRCAVQTRPALHWELFRHAAHVASGAQNGVEAGQFEFWVHWTQVLSVVRQT